MSRRYLMSRTMVLSVSLAGAIGVTLWAGTPQSGAVSREEAEALVADDPEMTPLEREGFVNALLLRPPKVRKESESIEKAANAVPAEVVAELQAAGGRGTAIVHLVLGESGDVLETRYVPQTPREGSSGRDAGALPLDGYGQWAAEVGRAWRFEPPAAAPYSFILELSHHVDEKGTTYEWRLRSTGRLTRQTAATVETGGPTPSRDVQGGREGGEPHDPTKLVRVGDGVESPTKTHHVDPIYPSEAKANGVEGVVVIEATIGTDGTVTDARVLKSIPALDQAALDAVLQWEFRPTLLNGEPVAVVMTTTVNFTLQ